jgi:hypothetical protein
MLIRHQLSGLAGYGIRLTGEVQLPLGTTVCVAWVMRVSKSVLSMLIVAWADMVVQVGESRRCHGNGLLIT